MYFTIRWSRGRDRHTSHFIKHVPHDQSPWNFVSVLVQPSYTCDASLVSSVISVKKNVCSYLLNVPRINRKRQQYTNIAHGLIPHSAVSTFLLLKFYMILNGSSCWWHWGYHKLLNSLLYSCKKSFSVS